MAESNQEKFDIAHEVTEIIQSQGFKTLADGLDTKITQVKTKLEKANRRMFDEVSKGGVDSEKFVQQVVALEGELKGLEFIINEVDFYKRQKEEVANKLD